VLILESSFEKRLARLILLLSLLILFVSRKNHQLIDQDQSRIIPLV
jgi:hypothetical protein